MVSIFDFPTPLLDNSIYFKILVDTISSTSGDFLDLRITAADGYLKVQPSLEKVPSPLCPSSCHHSSMHSAWPLAVAARVRSLAYDPEAAMAKLVAAYRHANAAPSILASFSKVLKPKQVNANTHEIVTCVLRYHPCFAYAFNRALTEAPLPPDFPFRVQPSWANALPSTASVAVKANASNSRHITYNDEGTSYLSEVGGNIVVVNPSHSTQGYMPSSPVLNITKFTFQSLHVAFLPK